MCSVSREITQPFKHCHPKRAREGSRAQQERGFSSEILRGVPLRMTMCMLLMLSGAIASADDKPLRICSDPNNLPFSNDKLEGFENKIADVIANELGRKIEYSWR